MEDRFKFRFWHKPTKKMVGCYGFNPDFVFGGTFDGIGTRYNPAKFDDCILMQCTGLKDKHGKLIYEGDICEYEFEEIGKQKAIIYFNTKLASFLSKPIDDFQFAKLNDCIVIGNVYENPELLEEYQNEN